MYQTINAKQELCKVMMRAEEPSCCLCCAASAWSHCKAGVIGDTSKNLGSSMLWTEMLVCLHNTAFSSCPSTCFFPLLHFFLTYIYIFFLNYCRNHLTKSRPRLSTRANSLREPAFEFRAQRSHYLAALSICRCMKCTLTHL